MDRFRTSPNRSEPVLNQFGKWIDKKPRKKTALGWICSPSDYCYYTLVHLSGLTLGAGPVLVLEPLSWVSDRSRSGGSEVNEPGATNRKVGGGAPVTMATLTWVPIGPPGGGHFLFGANASSVSIAGPNGDLASRWKNIKITAGNVFLCSFTTTTTSCFSQTTSCL